MSELSPDAFQLRQVYRWEEMKAIYHAGEGSIRRHEGDRYPHRMTPSLTVYPLWSKAAVWTHLGLAWPTDELMIGDFVSTGQLARYLSLNDHTVTELAREGKLPSSRMGQRLLFPHAHLTTLFGHPPLCWPKRADDLAFSVVKVERPAQMNGQIQAALIPVALDEDAIRRIVREEMRTVIAVIREVSSANNLRDRVVPFNVNSDPIGIKAT